MVFNIINEIKYSIRFVYITYEAVNSNKDKLVIKASLSKLWVGRDIKDHLDPDFLPKAPSSLVLGVLKMEHP